MKQLVLLANGVIMMLAFCSLYGCEKPQNDIQYETLPYTLEYSHIDLITIDSCEYIRINNGYRTWGSHKGNCKYCAERSKKKNGE